jgi:hypothetical protein
MLRIQAILAVLVLTATVALVPTQASAQKVLVNAAGSSAMWQTIALAAYNVGKCPKATPTPKSPCFHYTSSVNFELNDTRPTLNGLGGTVNQDAGAIWIVWDSSATPNVWAFTKVDSVVGNRCFFAQPQCNTTAPSSGFPTPGNDISSTLWGDGSSDSTPPASIQALFTAATGPLVNAAASDIRPEDANWADCRVNSDLGNGTPGFGDGLDGLGYNVNNTPGVCAPQSGATLAQLVGTPVKSGYPPQSATDTANVLAFNISGNDPFTGTAIPTTWTTVDVGADPVVFIFSRTSGALTNLTAATQSELQTLFSGTDCNASVFGLSANAIAAYIREPLSGTMNTTEAGVFRLPVETIEGTTKKNLVIGVSQETNIGAITASNNPLTYSGNPCKSGGGARARAIGTSEEVKSVLNSTKNNGVDGVGYAFFSFGNVSSLSSSAAEAADYGYVTVDGFDPIFTTYCTTGPCGDPGQPTGGVLPGAWSVCSGAGFPCNESKIWTTVSFPNLRSGNYGAWSLLRWVVDSGTNKTNVNDLILGSQTFAVGTTPDYVPALATTTGGFADPGLTVFRAHYQQLNGDGVYAATTAEKIGPAANNGTFNSKHNPTGGDHGGDMGGCVGTTDPSFTVAKGTIQTGPGTTCSSGAVRH